jgi:uncharacterized protein (TIGR00251 family)
VAAHRPYALSEDGLTVRVHVRPGASRNTIEGVRNGELAVRLRARVVEGAANAALIASIAECTGARKSAVQIVTGLRSRSKTLLLRTDESAEAARRLALAPAEGAEDSRG